MVAAASEGSLDTKRCSTFLRPHWVLFRMRVNHPHCGNIIYLNRGIWDTCSCVRQTYGCHTFSGWLCLLGESCHVASCEASICEGAINTSRSCLVVCLWSRPSPSMPLCLWGCGGLHDVSQAQSSAWPLSQGEEENQNRGLNVEPGSSQETLHRQRRTALNTAERLTQKTTTRTKWRNTALRQNMPTLQPLNIHYLWILHK